MGSKRHGPDVYRTKTDKAFRSEMNCRASTKSPSLCMALFVRFEYFPCLSLQYLVSEQYG